ncbi:MAG: hypothetical protein ACO1N4_03490 [Pedobacter sp.]
MKRAFLRAFFKALVKLNNLVMPSLYKEDPMKLSTFQKGVLGFRYWALTNSMK